MPQFRLTGRSLGGPTEIASPSDQIALAQQQLAESRAGRLSREAMAQQQLLLQQADQQALASLRANTQGLNLRRLDLAEQAQVSSQGLAAQQFGLEERQFGLREQALTQADALARLGITSREGISEAGIASREQIAEAGLGAAEGLAGQAQESRAALFRSETLARRGQATFENRLREESAAAERGRREAGITALVGALEGGVDLNDPEFVQALAQSGESPLQIVRAQQQGVRAQQESEDRAKRIEQVEIERGQNRIVIAANMLSPVLATNPFDDPEGFALQLTLAMNNAPSQEIRSLMARNAERFVALLAKQEAGTGAMDQAILGTQLLAGRQEAGMQRIEDTGVPTIPGALDLIPFLLGSEDLPGALPRTTAQARAELEKVIQDAERGGR